MEDPRVIYWESQLEASMVAVHVARRQLASLALRDQLAFPTNEPMAEVIELFPPEAA